MASDCRYAGLSPLYDRPGAGLRASLKAVTLMVAIERPDADCGHAAPLQQQCGRCLRWCCQLCYSPWMALACNWCRGITDMAVDRATVRPHDAAPERIPLPVPVDPPAETSRCHDRPLGPRSRHRRPSRRSTGYR